MGSDAIFLGIYGNVLALDRTTGQQLWCTSLKGADFVNLLVDGDLVIATTGGEAFALDATTGKGLWHNKLKGQGWGMAAIATARGNSAAGPIRRRQMESEQDSGNDNATG